MGRTAVIAGTASAVGGRVQHRQSEKWAQQDAQAQAAAPAQAPAAAAPAADPAPAAGGGGAMIERLRQLGALHDEGVLTDEEFAAQKAKILG